MLVYHVNRSTGEISEIVRDAKYHDAYTTTAPGQFGRAGTGEDIPGSFLHVDGVIYDTRPEAAAAQKMILRANKKRLRLIERADGTGYDVISGDNTYHVTFYLPEYMNDNVVVWKCDCPAAQHGRDCKHVQAVINHQS